MQLIFLSSNSVELLMFYDSDIVIKIIFFHDLMTAFMKYFK